MLKQPRIGLTIDLPLLREERPSLVDVIRLAKKINRPAGVTLLGQVNLLLSAAALNDDLHDGANNARATAQKLLIGTTISRARLNQFAAVLPHATLETHAIFHRRQVLAAIKLVALFGDPTKGNLLESREDLDAIAELALAINSLTDGGVFPADTTVRRHLAAQMAPGRELENPPRIDHALVRSHRMLGRFLQGRYNQPEAKDLERLFVFLTGGFSFSAYQDMMFGVFAYFQAPPHDNLAAFQQAAFLNPYAPGNIISGPLLETFLANMSIDPKALATVLAPVTDEGRLLFDLTTFRSFPIWRFAPNRYLCVDVLLIAERLASGFYWAVNQALDSPERRRSFSGLWGGLFEDHVTEVLRHATAGRRTQLIRAPFYRAPREEAFDAVVIEGTHAIVIEVKGLFATVEAKYSGRFLPFFKGLSEKFGNQPRAAVRQLAKNTRLTFGLPRVREIDTFDVRAIRCVWPVVIVVEPILGFGLASKLMVDRFEHRMRSLTLQVFTSIRPVVFLQVEDLEVIAQHVLEGDFTLVDVLKEKLAFDREHVHSFHDFFWGQFVPQHGLAFRRNADLMKDYETLTEAAFDRFHRGAYRDCLRTQYGTVFEREASGL